MKTGNLLILFNYYFLYNWYHIYLFFYKFYYLIFFLSVVKTSLNLPGMKLLRCLWNDSKDVEPLAKIDNLSDNEQCAGSKTQYFVHFVLCTAELSGFHMCPVSLI